MKKFPSKMTIGEKYEPAMKIEDQAEADAYFKKCVLHTMKCGKKTMEEAESIERQNLGYFAGYYGHETRERVERLFKCQHPYFGSAARGPVEPETALNIGHAIGRAMKH